MFVLILALVFIAVGILFLTRPPFPFARLAGLALTVVAALSVIGSLFTVVPTQQVGIPVTFGRPGSPLANGIHAKAPWTSVVLMDGTVQIADNLGPRRTEIRLGNQSVAFVQNSVRWRIKPEAADRLYRDHRSFERIAPALLDQELATALNESFKDFDPLSQATSNARSLDDVAASVKTRLETKMGDRLVIESVTIPKVDFDPQTQARIDAYQSEIGNTRIAEQRRKTAEAEAQANRTLSESVSKDPNVLVSKCMDAVNEMVAKGQPVPAGFSCWPGGSGTPVIADTVKR